MLRLWHFPPNTSIINCWSCYFRIEIHLFSAISMGISPCFSLLFPPASAMQCRGLPWWKAPHGEAPQRGSGPRGGRSGRQNRQHRGGDSRRAAAQGVHGVAAQEWMVRVKGYPAKMDLEWQIDDGFLMFFLIIVILMMVFNLNITCLVQISDGISMEYLWYTNNIFQTNDGDFMEYLGISVEYAISIKCTKWIQMILFTEFWSWKFDVVWDLYMYIYIYCIFFMGSWDFNRRKAFMADDPMAGGEDVEWLIRRGAPPQQFPSSKSTFENT